MKKFTLYGSTLLATILFTACGGGGGGSAQQNVSDPNKMYYLDAAVAGATYDCGSKHGDTESDGSLYFDTASDCVLKVGNIVLRTIPKGELAVGKKVIEKEVYTARFLQSIDFDGVPGNGIQVDSSVRDALVNAGKTAIPQTDSEVDDVINIIQVSDPTFAGERVSLSDAKAHIDSTTLLNLSDDISSEMPLSHSGYLQKLMLSINTGSTFGWKTTRETDALESSMSALDAKIAAAEVELADVDISASNENKINALLSNKSKLESLISSIKAKNVQLDTAINVGSSVADVNTIINEIKSLAKGDVFNYFNGLADYGRFPLPQVGTGDPDEYEVNRYLNQAGASALAFVNSMTGIYARMLLVSKAYTSSIQKALHDTYDTRNDTSPTSCSVANYQIQVPELDPQVKGQCQMAYFYSCSIDKYGPSYPDKVVEMENRRKVYCDLLDDWANTGANISSESCEWCTNTTHQDLNNTLPGSYYMNFSFNGDNYTFNTSYLNEIRDMSFLTNPPAPFRFEVSGTTFYNEQSHGKGLLFQMHFYIDDLNFSGKKYLTTSDIYKFSATHTNVATYSEYSTLGHVCNGCNPKPLDVSIEKSNNGYLITFDVDLFNESDFNDSNSYNIKGKAFIPDSKISMI